MDKDLEYLVSRVCSRACRTIVSEGIQGGTSEGYRVWDLKEMWLRTICCLMVGLRAAGAMRTTRGWFCN